LGCRWSPESYSDRYLVGLAGSRVATSKSITASYALLVRIHWLTAWRLASPSFVK
jgi:hypothetical protein